MLSFMWTGMRMVRDWSVVHHGALGSFATVYLEDGVDPGEIVALLSGLRGMELVLPRAEGCRRFELPEDRMGEVIAIARRHVVLGTSPSRHDLSGLDAPLRSHGGLSEQRVPLMMNRRAPGLPAEAKLRNFSAFDLALNHAAVAATPALSRAG